MAKVVRDLAANLARERENAGLAHEIVRRISADVTALCELPSARDVVTSPSLTPRTQGNRPAKTARKAANSAVIANTRTEKRYVRRSDAGQLQESHDVDRSLAADRRHKATAKVRADQGDKGDR